MATEESSAAEPADFTSSAPEGNELELADEDILAYGRSNLNSALLENILPHFKKFTLVQRKTIPLILSGNDVLIKAQTGSGKTLAALIPLLSLLLGRDEAFGQAELKLLIVVPSNDLIQQVTGVLKTLLHRCSNRVTFKGVAEPGETLANVVVTKPSVAVEAVKGQELLFLVVDEADLLFEFGYKDDTMRLVELLRGGARSKSFQSVLLSATLDAEIKTIASLLLYKPVFVDVPYAEKLGAVNEYYILVEDANKLVTLYVLLKMESIPFGSIIFNFNQGLIGCLVLIDDESDTDMSLSRGVDFKNVRCVINFDEPTSAEVYRHRIGRTGRNAQTGASLTFFARPDHALLLELTESGEPAGGPGAPAPGLQQLALDPAVFESFRYRINDVLKTITPKLVEIAQIQSVRHSAIEQEEFLKRVTDDDILLLKSVLKNDNKLLRPDKGHLTFIPKYLVDANAQSAINAIKYQIYPASADAAPRKRPRADRDAQRQARKDRPRKRKPARKRLPHFKRKRK